MTRTTEMRHVSSHTGARRVRGDEEKAGTNRSPILTWNRKYQDQDQDQHEHDIFLQTFEHIESENMKKKMDQMIL